ncbi:hypothetical protein F4820DRAFT_37822 [Hypoxylon rubiginosum]|uniref:Uncharacterized protein n=1 Tax=Hypoxylon rubiginosum TaxID=110542 RepID=A0ACB9YS84_9PEZI|nr:hypothetical protein F4820DRAFT_37822 [Hypoxylon rubiginosum]
MVAGYLLGTLSAMMHTSLLSSCRLTYLRYLSRYLSRQPYSPYLLHLTPSAVRAKVHIKVLRSQHSLLFYHIHMLTLRNVHIHAVRVTLIRI